MSERIWNCRQCGHTSDDCDSAPILHPAGYSYRAPLCAKCGHYFNGHDIALAQSREQTSVIATGD